MSKLVLQAQGLTKRFTEGRLDVTVLKGAKILIHDAVSLLLLPTTRFEM